jgi:hypothetical protein
LHARQARGPARRLPERRADAFGRVDAQLIYDPRDVGQTQGDKSTYLFSDNPILCLLAYLTDASGGMGLDYARFIEPAIDFWKDAADECDGLVATSGMHATLLDAAAVDDNKIFLADTTGLTVGATVSLPTEDVVVSGFGLAGEVDIAGTLAYAHQAGELANWPGFGQTVLYGCAGTYGHDTPPGDVIKSILSTFDGWLGQRGDGALVVRTNTVYTPTVVLGNDHIVGYQVQHYLPDEQVTNQYVVSYTDPASGFNKAEAGYVEDDDDIADRGTVRSNELYLQWVPSAPQALTVARALLARSTQALRGTTTCNLSGLAVLGQRYVKLQITELPDLTDTVVEITGKPTIDLASMTVSFPWVAASSASPTPPPTPIRVQEKAFSAWRSVILDGAPASGDLLLALGTAQADFLPVNTADGWSEIDRHYGVVNYLSADQPVYGVLAWKRVGSGESATQTPFSGAYVDKDAVAMIEISDCGDLPGALESITWASPPSPGAGGHGIVTATVDTAADDDMAVSLTGFNRTGVAFDTLALSGSAWVHLDHDQDTGGSASIVGHMPVPTAGTTITSTVEIGHDWYGLLTALVIVSPNVRDALPPLGPPSGSPLQPLDAPTITSVTPDYPNSGGGVQGARLIIEVDDPGIDNPTWKVQWKQSTDTLWTQLPGPLDAVDVPPLTIQTGLIAASGSIDVQVAYVTASQVSPWSATTTVTVDAPIAATTALTASEALTGGQVVNIWSSSGAKVRKANATDDSKPAHGFVLANVSSSATATVYLPGQVITGLTSLTPGATYYLDTTGGAITATQPSTSGNLVQRVGMALSATTLLFQPEILSEA